MKTEDSRETPRRFLFDQSFDAADERKKKPATEEPPPEPTFSQEELEAARQDGFAKGHRAGTDEAVSKSDTELAQLIASIGSQLPQIVSAQVRANERLLQDGARLGTEVLRKVLPAYTARHGTDEINELMTQCLQTLIDEPRIAIRVAPANTAAVGEHLESARASGGFDGRFIVDGDDSMGPSDCSIDWPGGGLERRETDIWRQIDAAVEQFLAESKGDAPIVEDDANEGALSGTGSDAEAAPAADVIHNANGERANDGDGAVGASEVLEDR